ncbi:uncharacterized protein BXZ73DRAFT_92969 [Epithele typhae]|uniref:uncharacterized protein n=1 Tax=Epithele typhae TaxID=378194 RepID=UPI002007FC95|nr:uncharacterized protein BXZ73DRAFT_92969 [Epithele typhae]KAH9913315.1 hypothetical protein BXZ73DRAFT_92969 [Epithele typhae]
MAQAEGHWFLLSDTPFLARGAHAVAITDAGLLVVYGGELAPRTPVDTGLGRDLTPRGTLHAVAAETLPEPRVGAAAVWYDGALYMWGGRGGPDMAPLDAHQTGVWRATFGGAAGNRGSVRWERVAAANEAAAPAPRSFHTAVVHGHIMYIHAGCPESGRLNTLHAFDLDTSTWEALASAPEPRAAAPRLKHPVSCVEHKLTFPFPGFCGQELPSAMGELDVYVISEDKWLTVQPVADAVHGSPGARSVHGFAPFRSPAPTPALAHGLAVLYHGEGAPSAEGHAGAGHFWDDAWVLSKGDDGSDDWDLRAGWAWHRLHTTGDEEHALDPPAGRGWFPGASWCDPAGHTQAVLFGGLLGTNERTGELWEMEVN